MRLAQLLAGLPVNSVSYPSRDGERAASTEIEGLEIQSLAYDSRQVADNCLFFAVQGEKADGHWYLDAAIRRGAVAVASERESPADLGAAWIRVPAIRPFMATAAHRFYEEPSTRLPLVGITGTNGKTTTAFLIHSILRQQAPALLMGTIKTIVGEREMESERTTPEAIDIQQTLWEALKSGCRAGVMEVSSHALFLQRVYQCHFPVAVFTNLTQDHLDFHGSFEAYFEAKSRLFRKDYNPGLKWAVLNEDDPFGRRIESGVQTGTGCRVPFGWGGVYGHGSVFDPGSTEVSVVRYGFGAHCDVFPVAYETSIEGTQLDLQLFGRRLKLRSSLAGKHNAYNIMAAVAACSLLEWPDRQLQEGIEELKNVPGRFEKVDIPADFTVVLDYAHTPDALENVLRLCRSLARRRVICLFGCGGDRDRAKRPVMGAIAVRDADLAIITSDNPRSEAPEKIIEEICAGIPAHQQDYEVVVNRRAAIARALQVARKDDIVLLAGKGHETYQEIEGQKHPFDEREIVKEAGGGRREAGG